MTNPDLSRRALLAAGAGGVVAATLPGLTTAAEAHEPAQRPNFLWFLTEDNGPYNGAYGDRVARTPHIDALAQGGIRFDVAYSAAPICAPSRFAYLTGLYPETAGPAQHMRATAKIPDTVRGFPEYLRQAGYYTTNNSKTDYNAPIDLAATWNASSGSAHWRNRPAGTPFFAQFTTMTNHESQMFAVTDGITDPADVHVPAFLPDTPEVRRGIAHFYNRQAVADAELGKRLAELDADGLADDTIVFYFGDNGGVMPWSKRYANDRGLHIPLVIRIPPKWRHLAPEPPGGHVSSPVHGVDFAPTVLHLAGLRPPEHMQGQPILGRRPRRQQVTVGGRSRMGERYDLQRAARDSRYLYIRNYLPHRPYGQNAGYMWQLPIYQIWEQAHLDGTLNPTQERFWDEKPFEELYDLHDDPDQVTNLAGSRRHSSTLERLRRSLDAHMVAINDNSFIPESHPVEGYQQSRAPGAYPLALVMKVAELAARRDPGKLDQLLRYLDHGNDIVRFWAAQGLLGLGTHAGAVAQAMTATFHAEPSVYVRIPLAEALARLGHTQHSVKFLAETLDTHPNTWVRLQALNALTFVGVAAMPYKAVVERAAALPDEYLGNAGRYLNHVLAGTYTPTTKIYGGMG
ncbi:sulfatase-like hydrolase/transferase [Phytohabitans sp. ZYX-F-186]|uniref:Sulfatase-like hydrolase/transferase n=1 Tax=Phytohabitans maris TaxID=3071409 RepID=A0ABU0Z9F1_9ACTN|nr:sulfatase-like hydrolase/transferase [Phytohabitans sp. ZYX-F-186]MDQ7903686.1 sulfatase-like hydrolase/transferase [Phytohabitans sp. ZYX-F-186]